MRNDPGRNVNDPEGSARLPPGQVLTLDLPEGMTLLEGRELQPVPVPAFLLPLAQLCQCPPGRDPFVPGQGLLAAQKYNRVGRCGAQPTSGEVTALLGWLSRLADACYEGGSDDDGTANQRAAS